MSGEVCPKCGVAVVPGYVRCPKCHFVLPPPRRGRASIAPGGTAVESQKAPVGAIILIIAAVGGMVAAYFALRSHREATAAPQEQPSLMAEPGSPAQAGPALAPAAPPPAPTTAPANPPSADAIATDLQHALDRQRLWSTVEVTGTGVEVRSSSCGDAAMRPALEAAAPQFKAAGVRRLRCLEESGTVVFTRDL